MASSSSSSTSATAYENHLTSLSLDELLAEPGVLQTQAHHLTSSLTSLTHSSYSTFLSLHESTNALSTSLSSFSDSLSSLVSKSLPALQRATSAWHTRTTDVLKDRGKARLVLEQHDKLKDLLDVPIFIDSCVRSGNFQEALQLANHVESLASRPDAPPILKSIHIEVQVAIAQMLIVLLGTLHEPGRKLPALWKAVNILRKMGVFETEIPPNLRSCLGATDLEDPVSGEELLALAFLSGRLGCLSTNLSTISRDITRLTNRSSQEDGPSSVADDSLSERDKEDVARYLKKYIDAWREGAYDILTQYSSIFLEQQSHQQPLLTAPKTNRRPSFQHTPSSPQPPTSSVGNRNLLPYLSSHLLSHIVPLLESTLPLLSLPLLPSLLTQLTYCATAFTRVGMDFRGVVSSSISAAVLSAVTRDLQSIKPILGEGKSSKRGKKPSEWLISASVRDNPPSMPSPNAQKPSPAHIPPHILVSFPPLAVFTNALLSVMNSLRLLAPINIVDSLMAELDDVLAKNGEELTGYLRPHLATPAEGKSAESNVARSSGDVYFANLVPFMRRALGEGVYGRKVEALSGGDDEDEEGQERGSHRLWLAVQEWEKLKG